MDIKICGITSLEDRDCVIEAGADYFGAVVEYPRSPRSLTLEQAAPFFAVTGIRAVAVTVNMNLQSLRALYERLHPFALQLHGEEPPACVAEVKGNLPCEVWKAIRIPAAGLTTMQSDQIKKAVTAYLQAGADLLLFDTIVPRITAHAGARPDMRGGTGKTFPWGLLQFVLPKPRPRFFIAGGLNPTNVTVAIHKAQPSGVDISSGIEIYPGKKSHEKIRDIVRKVRAITPTPPPA
jgi:phosphoribosylanthranilate isomerase